MNLTPTKIFTKGDSAENLPENENGLSSSPEIIISQITEYYQERVSKDLNDMAGHIINTLNSFKAETVPSDDVYEELEKYKSLIKIQQSVIQITNKINNTYLSH